KMATLETTVVEVTCGGPHTESRRSAGTRVACPLPSASGARVTGRRRPVWCVRSAVVDVRRPDVAEACRLRGGGQRWRGGAEVADDPGALARTRLPRHLPGGSRRHGPSPARRGR